MSSFSFRASPLIMAQNGSLDSLALEISPFGKKALIITESIHTELGNVARIKELLGTRGISCIVFDDVLPSDTTYSIDDAVVIGRGSHCDMIIGLGSVGTLSFAKAVSVISPLGITADKYYSEGLYSEERGLPFIEIPTSHRNPFMFRDECFLIRGSSRESHTCSVPKGSTVLVVSDPSLTQTIPAKYTASAAMEIVLTALDGLIYPKINFLSETVFKEAIKLTVSFMERAFYNPEDLVVREILSRAGLLTATGFSLVPPGTGVILPMAIAGKTINSNSPLSAMILPQFIESKLCCNSPRLIAVNSLLGLEPVNTPQEAADALGDFFRSKLALFGLPSRVKELQIDTRNLKMVGSYILSDQSLAERYEDQVPERDISELLESIY